jgi:hypothetical protein
VRALQAEAAALREETATATKERDLALQESSKRNMECASLSDTLSLLKTDLALATSSSGLF